MEQNMTLKKKETRSKARKWSAPTLKIQKANETILGGSNPTGANDNGCIGNGGANTCNSIYATS